MHSRYVVVCDRMQTGYSYDLSAETGDVFSEGFAPKYAPKEMLEMGVFEGRYMNDCEAEFPPDWFENAKTSLLPDQELNYFGIKSRQPLEVWRQKGWIYGRRAAYRLYLNRHPHPDYPGYRPTQRGASQFARCALPR